MLNLLILSKLFLQLAFGAVIYKTPDSPFPSGDVAINKVLLTGFSQTRTWLFTSNFEKFLRDKIVLPSNLATSGQLVQSINVSCDPFPHSVACGALNKDSSVEILKHKDSWIKVKSLSLTGWVPEEYITPLFSSKSFVLTKYPTVLFKESNLASKKVYSIGKNKKLLLIQNKGSWVQVTDGTFMGWALLSDFISLLDFAFTVNGEKVKNISGGWVQTEKESIFSLEQIKNVEFNKNIFFSDNKKQIATQIETVKWTSYYSSQTGLVWFADKDLNITNNQKAPTDNGSFLDANIFDLCAHPLIPEFRIASKNGIYISTDSKTWNKLDFFKNKNYPITITPTGVIYVGPYVSFDEARTFRPYLKFEHFFKAFQARGLPVPQKIALTSLNYIPHKDLLKIEINSKFSFESQDPQRRHWKLSDNVHRPRQSEFLLDSLIRISESVNSPRSLQRVKPLQKRLATIVSY